MLRLRIHADNDELPPPVLYSYSPGGAWLPSCLAGLSVKFSSRVDFNDPFDSRPGYQIDPTSIGRQYIHDKLKGINGLSPAKRALRVGQMHRYARSPRPFADLVTDKLLDSFGIMCLTEEWDEPLFWGHYAAKHTGICIGFRTDRDVFQLACKVIYQDELPIILRPNDSNDEMVRKALLTKSSAWKNEREWRIVKPKRLDDDIHNRKEAFAHLGPENARIIADQRGPGLYNFDPTAVESITMGMLISPENEKLVIEAVQSAPHPISLYKATRHGIKYKIDRKWVRVRRRND